VDAQTLEQVVIGAGAVTAGNGSYSLSATAGQPVAGAVSSGQNTGQIGFWATRNRAPALTPIGAQSTDEDTPLTLTLSAFDADGDALTFTAASDSENLTVAVSGVDLTLTPAQDFNGNVSVTVTVSDGNGGSDSETFTLTVNAVNDAPSFTKGADQTILWNSGPQTVPGWATGISAGPADESGQNLNFIVSNDNNALFSSPPTADPSGNLTYTTAPNASGVVTVTVSLHDDGGTNNGGADTSVPQTFTITVQSTADATQEVLTEVQNLISSGALDAGTAGSLTASLDAAITSAEAGNTTAASGQLAAFINKVNAQSGKKLTTEQADALTGAAQAIMDNIGAGSKGKGKKAKVQLAKVGDGTGEVLPEAFGLDQSYPNPFNPSTTIRYGLPEASNVSLVVYNILGQQVRTLVNGAQGPGYHSVVWDGRDEAGRVAATGVYIYRLQAGAFVQVKKMLFAK